MDEGIRSQGEGQRLIPRSPAGYKEHIDAHVCKHTPGDTRQYQGTTERKQGGSGDRIALFHKAARSCSLLCMRLGCAMA